MIWYTHSYGTRHTVWLGRLLRRVCWALPIDGPPVPAFPFDEKQHTVTSACSMHHKLGATVAVTALRLHKHEKVLEVTFSTGATQRFSAELLRVCSPSAENCSTGGNVKVPAGRRYVGIMGLELVGSYAVRIAFDDLHNTGLYTWEYLYELSNNKYSRAKQYIRVLRQQGLSRDPRQPKSQRNAGSKSSSSILE